MKDLPVQLYTTMRWNWAIRWDQLTARSRDRLDKLTVVQLSNKLPGVMQPMHLLLCSCEPPFLPCLDSQVSCFSSMLWRLPVSVHALCHTTVTAQTLIYTHEIWCGRKSFESWFWKLLWINLNMNSVFENRSSVNTWLSDIYLTSGPCLSPGTQSRSFTSQRRNKSPLWQQTAVGLSYVRTTRCPFRYQPKVLRCPLKPQTASFAHYTGLSPPPYTRVLQFRVPTSSKCLFFRLRTLAATQALHLLW
jgi:hypothetical protein